MADILPYFQHYPLTENGVDLFLFAFEIPYLPDFLADHTLLADQPSERLEEVLGRFERFIRGLRKYQGVAYSLRYISRPEEGATHIVLLTRLIIPAGREADLVNQVALDITAHMASFSIPYRALNYTANSQQELTLASVLQPFNQTAAIIELRQREQVMPLVSVGSEAYVIHPFWGGYGPLLEPFESLLRQPVPVVINIYLEPTEITAAEQRSLAEAGHIAQTVTDLELPVQSSTAVRRRRDPNAELVGKIYTTYLRSLDDAVICLVQVASPSAAAALTIARSYASAAIQTPSLSSSNTDPLPSTAEIIMPQTSADVSAARFTFERLLWSPWGLTLASVGKERFPYLMGARGASTIFRFPISVNGGVPGITVRQAAPDFEPGPRPNQAQHGEIHIGNYRRGGVAVAPLRDLTRHTLITGFTGSGKTNTVLYMLDQLWRLNQIPFLVIESAKKEYRALMRVKGMEDLLVFTLGDETTSPFRLNPFELLPGVRLEAHLGKLQACFDAALPQFGILPSIIAEAMERIYKEKGWKLTDRAADEEDRLFPTLRELFTEVIQVTERRGYAGETYQNIRAAAAGRIGSLLQGSKGRLFGSQRSLPSIVLFQKPVILEMNDLNEDDKALVMMFLLTWLREYRELHAGPSLQHVTVVEEAHNVLSNVQSSGPSEISADTKAKAVGAFSNMLSEVRSYGEGLIISDQSPEKLAPDAMRNTNLQIAHQLRDRRDREAIARAMIMDEEQQEYLGKLRIGEAAYFRTGIEKATFITVPEYKDTAGFLAPPVDEDIHKRMQVFHSQLFSASLPFDGCRFCGSTCMYREAIEPLSFDKELHERFIQAVLLFETHPSPVDWPQNWQQVASVCRQASRQAGLPDVLDASYCFLSHEIDFKFTPEMRNAFEKSMAALSEERRD